MKHLEFAKHKGAMQSYDDASTVIHAAQTHRGRDVVGRRVIREVQVVCEGRILGGDRVNLFDHRVEAHLLPGLPDDELGGVHALGNHFVLSINTSRKHNIHSLTWCMESSSTICDEDIVHGKEGACPPQACNRILSASWL
jgi:hypothetical protein